MMYKIHHVNDIIESLLEDKNLHYKFSIILEYDYEIIDRETNQFIFFHNEGTSLISQINAIRVPFIEMLNRYQTWRINVIFQKKLFHMDELS